MIPSLCLQDEIKAQEESVERLHRRAAEIQALLKSTDPPLELQVGWLDRQIDRYINRQIDYININAFYLLLQFLSILQSSQ